MAHKLPNYLKTLRKRSGLSQDELAFILGCETGSLVSHYEHGSRFPGLPMLLRYVAVFGVTLEQLFTGMADDAKEFVVNREKMLAERLSSSDEKRKKNAAKIAFLEKRINQDE